jgi:flagellar hook-associated protein 2
LQGEATAVSVVNELHTTVAGAIPAPAGDFASLSEIGITLQADGSLKLDESKLAAATAGESGIGKLARLFAATASNPDSFVTRIKAFVDKTQGSQGLIFWTTKGLSTTIQRLDKEQQNINRRLVGVEAYLREQFNTLDSRRGLHDAAEAYSANQNTIWSNNSK